MNNGKHFNLADKFGTDKDLEREGVWVDMSGGASIKVARIGNPEYKRMFQKITTPYKQQLRTNNMDEDIAEELLIKAMASTILLDWKGIYEGDEEMKYSIENAEKVLRDLPDFRVFVTEVSSEMELFRQGEQEEGIKNSPAS